VLSSLTRDSAGVVLIRRKTRYNVDVGLAGCLVTPEDGIEWKRGV
jgi:hypothetical protein